MCLCHRAWRSQGLSFENGFSHSTTWVPRIRLRLSHLAASSFIYWAMLATPLLVFVLLFFWDRVSCSWGWPWTVDPSASVSQELELQLCTTSSNLYLKENLGFWTSPSKVDFGLVPGASSVSHWLFVKLDRFLLWGLLRWLHKIHVSVATFFFIIFKKKNLRPGLVVRTFDPGTLEAAGHWVPGQPGQ